MLPSVTHNKAVPHKPRVHISPHAALRHAQQSRSTQSSGMHVSCLRVLQFPPLPGFTHRHFLILPETAQKTLRAPRGTRSPCVDASTSALAPPTPPAPSRLSRPPRPLSPLLSSVVLSMVQLGRLLPMGVVVGHCPRSLLLLVRGLVLSALRTPLASTPGNRDDEGSEGLRSPDHGTSRLCDIQYTRDQQARILTTKSASNMTRYTPHIVRRVDF